MAEVDIRLRKLPPLGDLPKLCDPTKGFTNGKQTKAKSKSKKCRSRSRTKRR